MKPLKLFGRALEMAERSVEKEGNSEARILDKGVGKVLIFHNYNECHICSGGIRHENRQYCLSSRIAHYFILNGFDS